jgi:hypothetical protein
VARERRANREPRGGRGWVSDVFPYFSAASCGRFRATRRRARFVRPLDNGSTLPLEKVKNRPTTEITGRANRRPFYRVCKNMILKRSRVLAVLVPLLASACGLLPPESPDTSGPLLTSPSPPPPTALPKPSGTPVLPPEPGVYMHTRVLEEGSDRTKYQTTQEFLPSVEVEPGMFRQRTWFSDDRGGRTYFSENLWRPDGVFTVASTFSFDTLCQWTPPHARLRFPLVVGMSWENEGVCSNDPTPRRAITSNHEVVRTEDLRIGDEEVATYVLEYRIELKRPGDEGTLSNEAAFWYAPAYRLNVKTKLKAGGAEYSDDLVNLTPQQ